MIEQGFTESVASSDFPAHLVPFLKRQRTSAIYMYVFTCRDFTFGFALLGMLLFCVPNLIKFGTAVGCTC